jgi:hypothetical protein
MIRWSMQPSRILGEQMSEKLSLLGQHVTHPPCSSSSLPRKFTFFVSLILLLKYVVYHIFLLSGFAQVYAELYVSVPLQTLGFTWLTDTCFDKTNKESSGHLCDETNQAESDSTRTSEWNFECYKMEIKFATPCQKHIEGT